MKSLTGLIALAQVLHLSLGGDGVTRDRHMGLPEIVELPQPFSPSALIFTTETPWLTAAECSLFRSEFERLLPKAYWNKEISFLESLPYVDGPDIEKSEQLAALWRRLREQAPQLCPSSVHLPSMCPCIDR